MLYAYVIGCIVSTVLLRLYILLSRRSEWFNEPEREEILPIVISSWIGVIVIILVFLSYILMNFLRTNHMEKFINWYCSLIFK